MYEDVMAESDTDAKIWKILVPLKLMNGIDDVIAALEKIMMRPEISNN
jgi:hypothetical protein